VGLRKGCLDVRYDAFEIFHQISIGKAQDLIALGMTIIVAAGVIFYAVVVGRAVEFDDEVEFTAKEISEIGADRHLTAEFVSKLSAAKLLPQ
jgi:hypothetical protein